VIGGDPEPGRVNTEFALPPAVPGIGVRCRVPMVAYVAETLRGVTSR